MITENEDLQINRPYTEQQTLPSSLLNIYQADFAYAHGQPVGSGKIKSQAADFRVDEVLGYELSHQGEHLYLDLRKQNLTTDEVVSMLAKAAGVPAKLVSYSGLKDKLAVTRQWFSIHLPGKTDPDWSMLQVPGDGSQLDASIEIIKQIRHDKKLRRGVHQANNFVIRINTLDADRDDFDARLQIIKEKGVPNYFGPQRFGYGGQNLLHGERILKGTERCRSRHKKGLYFSAVRSLLFNHVLSKRVKDASWDQYKVGDVLMLDGSHSVFVARGDEPGLDERVMCQSLHPTGPLWGEKGLRPESESGIFEQQSLAALAEVCTALEKNGLAYQRRSLRLKVSDLSWKHLDRQAVELSFSLPAGCFATVVLREIVKLD